MHRRRQKDEYNSRHELLLQNKTGRREADCDRDELADAVEHPRIIIRRCDEDKQREHEVIGVFSKKTKEQKALNDRKNQEIDMDVGADKCTDQTGQNCKSLVL